MVDKLMSPETQLHKEAYERGLRLQDVTGLPGWQDVLDMLDTLVAQAEYHLMNYNGSDPLIAMALQRRARAYRELQQQLMQQIQQALDAALPRQAHASTIAGLE